MHESNKLTARQQAWTIVPLQVNFLTLDEDSAGQRLDNFLFKVLKGVPKSHIFRIIRDGEVRLDKKRVDTNTRLAAGQLLRIPPIRLNLAAVSKHDGQHRFDHPIVFEDDDLIAINKPAGLAVHGGSGVNFGAIELLRLSREGGMFLELVHRLDRETSGLLFVAKTRKALVHMHEQLREGQTDKRYLVGVLGRFRNDRSHCKTPLTKYLLPSGERRVRPDADGQHAHTIFNVLERKGDYSLLEAELKTGRTHQIRVHCASLGYPIAGDDKYGDFDWNRSGQKIEGVPKLNRMFLHSHQFSFEHPRSGERMTITAPLAPELANWWEGITHDD